MFFYIDIILYDLYIIYRLSTLIMLLLVHCEMLCFSALHSVHIFHLHYSVAQHCGLDELKSPVTEGGSSERLCRQENSRLLCVAPALCLSRQCMRQVSCLSSATVAHCLHDPHLALETVDLSALDGDSGASVHTGNSVCRSHLCCRPLKISSHSACLWTHPSFSKTSFFSSFWHKIWHIFEVKWLRLVAVVNCRLAVLIGDSAVWVLCFPSTPLPVICLRKAAGRGMCQRLFGSLTFL